MRLLVPGRRFAYEMENVLRLFYPGQKIEVLGEGDPGGDETVTASAESTPGGSTNLFVRVRLEWTDTEISATLPPGCSQEETEWALARQLFELLVKKTGVRPPWGTLTGVRPVRLCRSMALSGMDQAEIRRTLALRSLVSPERIDLALQIYEIQRPLLRRLAPDSFSLYISIPFCPSRCLYCSFVSHDIRGMAALIPDYLRCLHEEIRHTGRLAERLGLRLSTVYIGGGTPTTLEPGQLRDLMLAVRESFDLTHLLEYTVEAGRPDTITAEKLEALRELGVDRVSINPQTMDDGILRAIGRGHTADDTHRAYQLARKAGFPTINMDLIAGLPGENVESFGRTLGEIAHFAPENITLHTLTVKRSSRLREQPGAFAPDADIGGLLENARAAFTAAHYRPYYLYRQKGTVQNLENTGYALRGHEGLYNILIMEELQTILAVGAGAVSKLVRPGTGLHRLYNYKFPQEYIRGFDEMLRRKDEAEALLAESARDSLVP